MVKDGYNGLLAEVRNPQDLANKIDILLSDDSLRKTMGDHSRTRLLDKFSLESYVTNYSKIYEGLVKNHG